MSKRISEIGGFTLHQLSILSVVQGSCMRSIWRGNPSLAKTVRYEKSLRETFVVKKLNLQFFNEESSTGAKCIIRRLFISLSLLNTEFVYKKICSHVLHWVTWRGKGRPYKEISSWSKIKKQTKPIHRSLTLYFAIV